MSEIVAAVVALGTTIRVFPRRGSRPPQPEGWSEQ